MTSLLFCSARVRGREIERVKTGTAAAATSDAEEDAQEEYGYLYTSQAASQAQGLASGLAEASRGELAVQPNARGGVEQQR